MTFVDTKHGVRRSVGVVGSVNRTSIGGVGVHPLPSERLIPSAEADCRRDAGAVPRPQASRRLSPPATIDRRSPSPGSLDTGIPPGGGPWGVPPGEILGGPWGGDPGGPWLNGPRGAPRLAGGARGARGVYISEGI